MPASGPVYQPTTVGYEQQNEWSRPGSYLSQTMSGGFLSTLCVQLILLASAVFSLLVGTIMIVEATGNVIIAVAGGLILIIGIFLLAVYIKIVRKRKGCPCFPTKEQRLARQLDTQSGNGQILTLNPSTDLLVAAQYGPVSEIAYQPPQVSEEEETRKLMASDHHKECTDENERMLDPDPRIVLRPLSHAEDA